MIEIPQIQCDPMKRKNYEMVMQLLARSDTNLRDDYSNTALSHAIRYFEGDELKHILNVINSTYNIHNHTSSCFGKEVKLHNNKNLNSSIKKNPKCYECRYKYLRMPSRRTTIHEVDDLK